MSACAGKFRHSATRSIPPMEEIGLGSGVSSDGGFDLSSAPLQPVEQRFAFEPGSSFAGGAPSIAPPAPVRSNWMRNLAGPKR